MITAIELKDVKEAIIKDPGCKVYIAIAEPPRFLKFHNIQICGVLAPQNKLLRDLKQELINKDEFRRKYLNYLKNNPITTEMINFIIKESKEKDIYLVCNSHSQCQRLVLMEMFDNISMGVRA